MALEFVENVYGITALGKKVKIGTVQTEEEGYTKVGGAIFYIDSTAAGATYRFYDYYGNEIPEQDIVVGSKPYAYKVTGIADKDKYYIVRPYEAGLVGTWSYKTDPEGSDTDVEAFDMLPTGATLTGIGNGKANTQAVMTVRDGVFAQTSGTAWNKLSALNSSDADNDWYIPNEEELATFINANSTAPAGTFDYAFVPGRYMTSKEAGASTNTSQSARTYQVFTTPKWTGEYKYYEFCFVPIRSF